MDMLNKSFQFMGLLLFLTGFAGALLSFFFIYGQRFFEAAMAGFLSVLLIRGGIMILRILTAKASLESAHERILKHMG